MSQYQIVKITYEGIGQLNNKVVIVPYDYVTFNENIPQHYVRYLEPPHNADDKEFLESMIRRKVYPVPQDWMFYECELVTTASTYNEALQILATLDQENTNGEKVEKRPTLTQSKKIKVTETSLLNKENDETTFRKSNGKPNKNEKNTPQSLKKRKISTDRNNIKNKVVPNTAMQKSHVKNQLNLESPRNKKLVGNLFNVPGLNIKNVMSSESISVNKDNMQPTSLDIMQNRINEKQRDLISAESTKAITEKHSDDEIFTVILEDEHDEFDPLAENDIILNYQKPSDGSIGQVSVETSSKPISKLSVTNIPQTDVNNEDSEIVDITNDMIKKSDLHTLKNEILSLVRHEFTRMNSKICFLQMKIIELQNLIIKQKPMDDQSKILTFHGFVTKHNNYNLPLKTVADFENFDGDLQNKINNVYNDLIMLFTTIINPKADLCDALTVLFKSFFCRDVLVQYTAQKKNKNKKLFKETVFYVCLRESLFQLFKNETNQLEERTIKQVIGAVFNNSKDWEGYRRKREKPQGDDPLKIIEDAEDL